MIKTASQLVKSKAPISDEMKKHLITLMEAELADIKIRLKKAKLKNS